MARSSQATGRRGSVGGDASRLPLHSAVVDEAMARLAEDLASGGWRTAHQHLLALDEVDAGCRVVVSDPGRQRP